MSAQMIDREEALEARITAEYNAMCDSYIAGCHSKARTHYREMTKLQGMRSKDTVARMERKMGLK